MTSTRLLGAGPVLLVVVAALVSARCGGTDGVSPTEPASVAVPAVAPAPAPAPAAPPAPEPAPAPVPAPAPAPTPAPPTSTARLEVRTNPPSPVPFSGQPVSDVASCASLTNTWFYDQVIEETSGISVTITRRVDKFDNAVVNDRNGLNISVATGSGNKTTIPTRWCSAARTYPSGNHTAQTTFSGVDANGRSFTLVGPVVELRP